jgi:hypothetical protein
MVAAGAAVLAVVAAGVLVGVVRDNGSTTTNEGPNGPQMVQKFHPKGNDHQTGTWNHAGTSSGGKPQLGLP